MPTPLADVPPEVKAALVMLMLGEEVAAGMFQHFTKEDIKSLNKGMNKLAELDTETREAVLQEYFELLRKTDPTMLVEGDEYMRRLMQKTMGNEQGQRLLQEISDEADMHLTALEPVDPRTLANLVRKEHPQTIALVMGHIEPAKAASVLGQLPLETQVEVCVRMASLDAVSPQTLREVERALMSEMKGMVVAGGEETSGVELVAELLNKIEKAQEERIFEQLIEIDPELAEEIRNKMFVFEDLTAVDDRGMQTLLKEVDNNTLLLALKTASDAVRDKVFRNLSQRAVQMLREDMEIMGPTRLSEVEKAQTAITQTALRLQAEGRIVIAKGGSDDAFV